MSEVKFEMSTNPRQRMIQSALMLMGEHGVEATSFSQIIEHSGAPRGSIYHHFPGGKAQLVAEATRYAGDALVDFVNAAVEKHDDPKAGLEAIAALWRRLLTDSGFSAGCPVLAAALEGDRWPAARDAAREVFTRWQDQTAGLYRWAGLPDERARSLAAIQISAVEGAVVLARAQRSSAPLERVIGELTSLREGALASASAH